MLVLIAAALDWANMSQNGVINSVIGVLLLAVVGLLARFVNNDIKNRTDMKQEHEAERKIFREEGEQYRKLIREENALVRNQHREDIGILFADAKEDRKVTAAGFHELATAVRSLQQELHQRRTGA